MNQSNLKLDDSVDVINNASNDIVNTGIVTYIIRDRAGKVVGYRVTNKHTNQIHVLADNSIQRCQYA